ncbi:MAG: acetolactate synthase large subunit [Xanthomonadales bacterium]|nr:acetolactate synthase large subunit [Xanthomonadales bacterium]
MKASDLFVKCLEEEGVEFIYGVPGEENLDVLESIRKSNIKLILNRHEQAGGFMAATYGRLTGKAGVCMSTLGPGATNLVTAAAYAQLGAMPMVMVTGQKPVKTSKQGAFQILDIVGMMKPLTKFTHQLVSGENIPNKVREAFRLAEEERPGATHLEFPEDICTEEVELEPFKASLHRRPIAEDNSIVAAVNMIESAKSPLLLIGAGANRKLTGKMLTAMVDKLGIPFCTTQMGKGVVDESRPEFIGNTALSANDFVHRAINHADVIINVGHDVIEKPPFFMTDHDVEVIHMGFKSAEVDPVYFPQLEVIGDIANAIWRVNEKIKPQEHWNFDFFERVRDKLTEQIAEGTEDDRCPIYPQRLVKDVRTVMHSDGIIALDNGVYKIWFARNYLAERPNTVLLDNALATMGAGLPSAMAARLVYPDKRVMAICGDGGFMMNSQELETAVRLKMDLVVIILRDDAYGMIKWKQLNYGFQNYGLDYGNPDFVKYAESYGAHGHRVESAAGLAPLMEHCHSAPGVHVIDCPVDYSENDRILNYEIQERAAAI